MSRTLLDIIGDDIIGAIFKIGNIHVHQLENGEWHAYVVAWDDRQEDIFRKHQGERYVPEDIIAKQDREVSIALSPWIYGNYPIPQGAAGVWSQPD